MIRIRRRRRWHQRNSLFGLLVLMAIVATTLITNNEQPLLVELATVIRVIDGDTIVVNLNGVEERIRFIGIDAPEMGFHGGVYESGATEATEFVTRMIAEAGNVVHLRAEGRNRDRWERLRRHVYVGEVHLGCLMVELGHAKIMTISGDAPLICS